DQQNRRQFPAAEVTRERHRVGDGSPPGLIAPVDGQHRKCQSDNDLTDRLRTTPQPQTTLFRYLDVIVDEPDQAEPAEQEQQEQRRYAGLPSGRQFRDGITRDDGEHDNQPAHGGGAAFGVMGRRSVIADQLAVALGDENLDGETSADQRAQQGHLTGDQNGLHTCSGSCLARSGVSGSRLSGSWRMSRPGSRSASATCSRRAARDALTKTTSPGRSRPESASTAAAGPSTGVAISAAPPEASAASPSSRPTPIPSA